MAWSATTDLFPAATNITSATVPTTNLSTEWDLSTANSNVINLNAGESCQIQIVAAAGSTIGDLQFRIVTSPDGGVTWDTIPYMSGSIGGITVSVNHTRTITVYGVKTFKLQFAPSTAFAWSIKGAGSTPKSTYIKDGISA